MVTYSRNDFKPPDIDKIFSTPFKSAGNASDGVGNNKLPVIKPWGNLPAIYQRDTTYGCNFSTDHGENNLKRNKEETIAKKFRHSVDPFLSTQPTFSKQYNSSRLLLDSKLNNMLENHTNKLDFNKRDFKFKQGQATPPLLQKEKKDKVSPLNINWIEKRDAEIKVRQIKNGECIPSMSQLQLYGRRKPKSKFEQAGLWITKTDITAGKPSKRYLL